MTFIFRKPLQSEHFCLLEQVQFREVLLYMEISHDIANFLMHVSVITLKTCLIFRILVKLNIYSCKNLKASKHFYVYSYLFWDFFPEIPKSSHYFWIGKGSIYQYLLYLVEYPVFMQY